MNFFKEHYKKTVKERKKLLKVSECHQKDINDSIYIGKTITSIETNKTYIVERDWEEYCSSGNGWFKRMLVSFNGSHATIIYENINSEDEAILSIIEKNRKKFNF